MANYRNSRNNGTCRLPETRERTGRCNCKNTMTRLRQVDFAIQETVLYLDAYPKCREAMALYRSLTAERRQLVAQYEEACGPLTMYGNLGDTWQWTETPWPWEPEAN